METEAKKKGLLATIWESMTKTGGCCGPGESCCGPSNEDNKKSNGKKKAAESDNGQERQSASRRPPQGAHGACR